MNISNKVKEMIELRELSISEISRRSGLARQTIYQILNDRTDRITLPVIKKLSAALGCTPGWLFR